MAGTRPIKVRNPHFLLDLLHADTAPGQQYRELHQNAVEAILAAQAAGLKDSGEVFWTYAQDFLDEHKLWKLCVIDDGIGMTGETMTQFIAELACSTKVQGLSANYGVGARITAGADNPIGVVFRSWVEGVGAEVQFWRDPKSGIYGLRRERNEAGDFVEVFEPGSKPDLIDQHGTQVVLLGKTMREDTARAKNPSDGPHWLARYLNGRYFRFPSTVRVRVVELTGKEPKDQRVRAVRGAGHYLDQASTARGSVRLHDAEVRWWILPESTARMPMWAPRAGHIAAMWKDELYEVREGKSRNALLGQFGVVIGGQRVVVYAEPKNGDTIRSDASRRRLTLNGLNLPWDRWAEEFRRRLPQELQDFQRELLEKAEQQRDATESDAVKRRLEEIRELLKIQRYRPGAGAGLEAQVQGQDVAEGRATVEREETEDQEPEEREPSEPEEREPQERFPTKPKPSVKGQEDKDRSEAGLPPEVVWVSIAAGTRSADDGMEDKAAQHDPAGNRVLMNADFRGYGELLRAVVEQHELPEETVPMVRAMVRQEAACAVVEAVMGVRTLAGSLHWDLSSMEEAWSPEALTSVVMVRFHVVQAIRRRLAQHVGRRA